MGAGVRRLTSNGQRSPAAPPHVASVRRHFIDLLTPEEIDTPAAIATRSSII
jgi:hypothetical protein